MIRIILSENQNVFNAKEGENKTKQNKGKKVFKKKKIQNVFYEHELSSNSQVEEQ